MQKLMRNHLDFKMDKGDECKDDAKCQISSERIKEMNAEVDAKGFPGQEIGSQEEAFVLHHRDNLRRHQG